MVIYQRIEVEHYARPAEGAARRLHVKSTQSRFAERILADFDREIGQFWQIVPKEMLDKLEVPVTRRRRRADRLSARCPPDQLGRQGRARPAASRRAELDTGCAMHARHAGTCVGAGLLLLLLGAARGGRRALLGFPRCPVRRRRHQQQQRRSRARASLARRRRDTLQMTSSAVPPHLASRAQVSGIGRPGPILPIAKKEAGAPDSWGDAPAHRFR